RRSVPPAPMRVPAQRTSVLGALLRMPAPAANASKGMLSAANASAPPWVPEREVPRQWRSLWMPLARLVPHRPLREDSWLAQDACSPTNLSRDCGAVLSQVARWLAQAPVDIRQSLDRLCLEPSARRPILRVP